MFVFQSKSADSRSRQVNLFQYQAWPSSANVPQSKTSLMNLIDLVEKSQYKTGGGPVLIHCLLAQLTRTHVLKTITSRNWTLCYSDGASQSGLYAAHR